MMRSVASRYALRGLRRQLRRTLLSVVGVGIGCAVGLITISWIRGEEEMIIRAAAECGAGHLRIVPHEWPVRRDRALRLADWEATLHRARAIPEVLVATPRARVQGLLGLGTRVTSAEVVGVDAETEQASLRFVREIAQGRYLRPGERGVAVVGQGVLRRLDAQLEDELLLTAMDSGGEMRSMLLTVVGVVSTGSKNLDRTIVQIPLADTTDLSSAPGAGEITILLSDRRDAARVKQALVQHLPDGQLALHWDQVATELRAGYQMDQGFARVTISIVIALVLLGVMSAQLASVLERRKEFAVLAALGMGGWPMVRVVLIESLTVGALGSSLGLALALPVVHYLATTGISVADVMGGADLAMSGVLLDPVFYADLGLWILPHALTLAMTATVLAALYPAFHATRTDPANALRVAQ